MDLGLAEGGTAPCAERSEPVELCMPVWCANLAPVRCVDRGNAYATTDCAEKAWFCEEVGERFTGAALCGRIGSKVVAQLTKQQVFELYAMREILEGSAARFAARHANEAEIEILYRIQRELAESQGDALTLINLNRRFHQAIYEAAHNQYLLETLDTLNDSMALLHSTTFRAPSRRAESDEEHRRIVEAIEKHDPDTAEKIAREHIRQAQRTRFETLLTGR